jgi:hypothetical protein
MSNFIYIIFLSGCVVAFFYFTKGARKQAVSEATDRRIFKRRLIRELEAANLAGQLLLGRSEFNDDELKEIIADRKKLIEDVKKYV